MCLEREELSIIVFGDCRLDDLLANIPNASSASLFIECKEMMNSKCFMLQIKIYY
jgi:hypothetical protein